MAARGKSWGDTKEAAFKNESWDKKVDFFQFPNNEELRIRLVGPVYIVGRHWATILTKFVPGQKPKVYPAWCTKFDSVTEEGNPDRVCPLCDEFDLYLEKLAICNVIIRKFQDGKNRRGNPVVPVCWRHSDVDKVFKKAFEKFKADPAHPEKGCDFSVEYDPNNKKNRWTIQREDQTPLSEEELAYDLTDFDALIPDYEDDALMSEHAREMRKSIARSGYYVLPLKNGEDGWAAYKATPDGKPYTAYPDLVAFKDGKQASAHSSKSDDDDMPVARRHRVDDAEEDAPVSSKPKPKPAPKPVEVEEEEEVVEEEPAPKPVVKPATKPASKPVVKVEEPEEEASEEEEAPVPPPKPRVSVKTPPPIEVEEAAEEEEEVVEEEVKPVAKAPAKKPEVVKAEAAVPAKNEAWAKKFGITFEMKNKKSVPTCYGAYSGAKKCITCPESAACIESSDSAES